MQQLQVTGKVALVLEALAAGGHRAPVRPPFRVLLRDPVRQADLTGQVAVLVRVRRQLVLRHGHLLGAAVLVDGEQQWTVATLQLTAVSCGS